jgi:hypothetical protein
MGQMLASSGWHKISSELTGYRIKPSAKISKQWLAREISSELTCYPIKTLGKDQQAVARTRDLKRTHKLSNQAIGQGSAMHR